ncbi:hypothetical protein ACOSQ3_003048 [Xanthoceras sorbifolium]
MFGCKFLWRIGYLSITNYCNLFFAPFRSPKLSFIIGLKFGFASFCCGRMGQERENQVVWEHAGFLDCCQFWRFVSGWRLVLTTELVFRNQPNLPA